MYRQLGRDTVVLLGVGHTNAHVLRMWKMKPPTGAQLVCVSDFPIVTYSGMLPGVLAGQYPKSAMEIDLVRLTQSVGARLIVDRVNGLDLEQQQILFDDRPPLKFDLLSIGIGSKPSFTGVEIEDPSKLLAVKPMQTFVQRFAARLKQFESGMGSPRIAIVGGGIGSVEIAFCLHQRFFGNPKFELENLPGGLKPEIALVTGNEQPGTGLLATTQQKIDSELKRRGIKCLTNSRVVAIADDGLQLRSGETIAADIVIWATNATGTEMLGQFGLPNDESGFLLTRPTLQSLGSDSIFAVGDSGTIVDSNLPKAGVYAVRQGPVLWKNIGRSLRGHSLEPYRPQSDFLKLINLGDDRAIAQNKGLSFSGRSWWRLKDFIDVRFMKKYQDYRPMEMSADSLEPPPMKCLGCGGKIGSQILSDALRPFQQQSYSHVKIGLENPDDAAVIRTESKEVTVTTDFFAAPFDDPFLIGRIAALNAASDCFVMGARPTAALTMVQLPEGHSRSQSQVMNEVMAGSAQEFAVMEAPIVGGHSIEGPRLLVGFTVLGSQVVEPLTKGQLRAGDQLVLTKPLGSGILLAAWMQAEIPASSYRPLLDSMLSSNAIALELASRFGVSAMTDVTGFGLIGHLVEMLESSRLSAQLDLNAVPVLPGCRELIELGIESTLAPDNRAIASRVAMPDFDCDGRLAAPLFDPQTSGGLLFGIPESKAAEVVAFLHESGLPDSCIIGQILSQQWESKVEIHSGGL